MRRKLAGLAMLLVAVWTAGCASTSSEAGTAPDPLTPTLQVTPGAERVRFLFQVLNTTGAPLTLTFPTGQSAEFEVHRNGERIWRWSDDRMFTQAVREEVLGAGESRSFEAEWAPPAGTVGELEAVARLTAVESQVDQAVRFSLP